MRSVVLVGAAEPDCSLQLLQEILPDDITIQAVANNKELKEHLVNDPPTILVVGSEVAKAGHCTLVRTAATAIPSIPLIILPDRYFSRSAGSIAAMITAALEEQTGIPGQYNELEQLEARIRIRDEILDAIAGIANLFLIAPSLPEAIDAALRRLGLATGAGRVYLYEKYTSAKGHTVISPRHEWCAPGITSQLHNPAYKEINFRALGFQNAESRLLAGEAFSFMIRGLPARSRKLWEGDNVQTVLLVPVFTGDTLWGVLGLDKFDTGRQWTAIETDALLTAAGAIGAAILADRMFKTLETSERRYRLLAETAGDSITVVDDQMRLEYINTAGAAMFGALPEELINRPVHEFFPSELAPLYLDEVKKVFLTGEEHTGEWPVSYPGSRRWLNISLNPIVGDKGQVSAVLTIARNISERKQAEQSLRLANRKLQLLTSITRHDLLNTLNGVLAYTTLAQETTSIDERNEYLDGINLLGETMKRQIEFTRDYQDLGAAELQWTRPAECFGTVCAQTPLSGIGIESSLDDYEILVDPLFSRVCSNLLDNTLRHGGEVTAIRAYAGEDGYYLNLYYEDDGVGIPAAYKKRIFEPGFGQNTGLGLFLVREILDISGIAIQETGVEGEGARFEMRVPPGCWRHGNECDGTETP